MSYHLYQTEAFVLDERPFGEANKVYYLLTPDLGLVMASAQGIRLLKSKLRFHMNKYSYVKIVLVRGKETWRLIGSEKIREYKNVYANSDKLQYASKIFFLLQRFIHGETPQKLLFEDLKKSLACLDKLDLPLTSRKLLSAWEQVTVLRILHFLGYIKDIPKLAPFIVFDLWTESILKEVSINQGFLVGIINEAIEISHI